MLSGKNGEANTAFIWFDASMAAVVADQRGWCCESSRRLTNTALQILQASAGFHTNRFNSFKCLLLKLIYLMKIIQLENFMNILFPFWTVQ